MRGGHPHNPLSSYYHGTRKHLRLICTGQSQPQTSNWTWWVKFKTTALHWFKQLWQVTGPLVQIWLLGPISRVWGSPRASGQLDFLWEVLLFFSVTPEVGIVGVALPQSYFLPQNGGWGLRLFRPGSWLLCHYFTTLSNIQWTHLLPVHLLPDISMSEEPYSVFSLRDFDMSFMPLLFCRQPIPTLSVSLCLFVCLFLSFNILPNTTSGNHI